MPQTRSQRAYWANRRKNERAVGSQLPKPKRTYALLATSVEEYEKLKREYPNMKITLKLPSEQGQLFDTAGFKDV